jgi:O-methyltransferase
MKTEDLDSLLDQLKREMALAGPEATVGIVGLTPTALDLVGFFVALAAEERLAGIYTSDGSTESVVAFGAPKAISRLGDDRPQIVIIASDENKEALISEAVPYLTPETRILVGGFGHFRFRDKIFEEETANPLVPSLANGYPNSLIHMYQCLANAARLGLDGVVAEFGMFKGGTTMLLSRFVERLGQTWKVYGFDTFGGFPPPRSPLDMYAHPDCVFSDEAAVRQYLANRNVEIVRGDLTQTASIMRDKDIILAFVETDNYSSATCVLDAIQDRVLVGGAILFDHFTGRDRFLYTLGERFAAKRLLTDPRYFNLHDTGVFWRQR